MLCSFVGIKKWFKLTDFPLNFNIQPFLLRWFYKSSVRCSGASSNTVGYDSPWSLKQTHSSGRALRSVSWISSFYRLGKQRRSVITQDYDYLKLQPLYSWPPDPAPCLPKTLGNCTIYRLFIVFLPDQNIILGRTEASVCFFPLNISPTSQTVCARK